MWSKFKKLCIDCLINLSAGILIVLIYGAVIVVPMTLIGACLWLLFKMFGGI